MTPRAPRPGYGPRMPVNVLIADDQALVRAGFRAILEARPGIAVVGEAGDGLAAVDLARRRRPDVVLMDIRMPGVDGIEATRRIVEDRRRVAVLMLTTFDLDEYVYDALRAGASGFLLKDVPAEELIEAVRDRGRGRRADRPGDHEAADRAVRAQRAAAGAGRRAGAAHPARARGARAWSPAASPTPRSPPSSCSARRPSRRTSSGS